MKAIATIVSLLSLPISMYITHSLLVGIHADRLLMFLFWVNLPMIVLVHLLSSIISQAKK